MHNYNSSIYEDDSNGTLFADLEHMPSSRHGQKHSSGQGNSYHQPEFKIPDVQYLNPSDPTINFKDETLKLIQANAILTEIIKETIVEKYSLNEKIIEVSDKIRKLQNPHSHHQQSQNNQQSYGQMGGSMGNIMQK